MPDLSDNTRSFQPLFELGRGGVAVVRAERMVDERGHARIVAVKRLLPMVAESRETRRMFLDEARLAAMLEHPNIVRIEDFGETDEPYIAMEMVLGETLASLVSRAHSKNIDPLTPELALHVAAQVCDALHAAHELKHPDTGAPLHLVHRDVSPQNVLVGYDGTVKLTDFGIAKAMGYGARTRTGDIKGKVPYMSPEQALGEDVDRRSDLFALGAVLFESLCGRRALGEGNEIDMLRRLATEAPPSLERAWPTAPPKARELFACLMRRDPRERPATAQDVSRALRELLKEMHVSPTQGALASRIAMLAPGKLDALNERLREANVEAQRQEPYLDEIEAFVDRPSALFRERRRARAMLGVGIASLLAAVGFGIAFATTREDSAIRSAASASTATTAGTADAVVSGRDPRPADAAADTPKIDADAAPRDVEPVRPSLPASRPTKRTPPPPSAAPPDTTKPHDGLDENPF